MHERGQTEIFSVLLSIVITVLVSVGIVYQLKARASRQLEFRKLQQMVAAESARAEEAAVEEYTSMLESNNFCAICQTPTKTRCSRCKAVHYCSSTCQVQHWNQGHKLKCRAPVISSIAKTCDLKVDNDDTTCKGGSSRNIVMSIPNENATKNIFSKGFMQKGYKIDDYDSQCNGIAKTSAKTINKDGQQLVQNKVSDGLPNSALAVEGRLSNPRKILFSYDHFVKLFHWDMLRPPCGLINCGNSCFANVVLQCLTYTRPLSAYLLFGSHRQECQRNDWCFMCELQDHINRTFKSEDAFSPIRILSRLRHIGNHLGYGRQEDAHEFMRFAVDSMQSICLDEAGGEKVVDIRSQETTIIQYMFGGHLQSQVKCMQCHHESNRYENMMDLTVEIQGPVESLEGALTQFTACEWLDGDNKYKCDRCAAYVKARKRLTVHEAPNILTIALKRFQSGKFGKLNKRVSFPEVLDVSPYMSGKRDDPPLYRLYAVVVHVDMLNASFFGHYICYVKDMEGVWYKIDDSKVKEVDLEVVLSQNAYMLLYSRTSPRPGPVVERVVVTSSSTTMNACKTEKSSPNGKLSASSETRPTPNETSATNLVDATVLAPSANIRDTTRAGVCAVSHHEPVRSKLLESSFVTERCTSLGRMDIDMFTDDCGSLASNSSTSEHDTDSSNNSSESIQSSLECDGNCNSLQPFEKVMGKSCKRRLDTRLLPLAAEKPLETDKMPVCTLANDQTSFSCTPLTSYNTNLVASSVSGDSLERGISNNDSSVTVSQKYHGSQNMFETQHNSNPPQNMQLCNGDTLGSAKRPHVESYANGADVLFSPSKASLKLRFMEIESDEPSPERVVYLHRDMARSDQCTPLPECRTDTRLEDEVLLASTLHSNCSMPDAMKEIATDNDVRVCQMPR